MTSLAGLGSPPNTRDGNRVLDREGNPLVLGRPHGPMAVLLSCGPDRRLDTPHRAGRSALTCRGTMELGLSYVHGTPGQVYDDRVYWVSKNVLLSYLVVGGVWPR